MPLLEAIITAFAPHYCFVCGYEGAVLCSACAESELMSVPARCYKCHMQANDSKTCKSCRRKSPLGRVWVGTSYDDKSSQLIIDYKFNRMRAAHKPIAELMTATLPLLPKNTLVVPVPTSTSRIRERGYDHAALLARHLADRLDLVFIRPAVRFGQAHQFGSTRKKRLEQLNEAFMINKPRLIKNKKVLIVDDVLTTGSTLETFGRYLRRAGAKQVDAVVFAQKQ